MKHYLRTPLPGLLVLIGAWQIVSGWNWAIRPTPSRIAGVEWMPANITTQHVGLLLLASGVITLIGGLLSRVRWLRSVATYAAIFVPLLVAAAFLGAAAESGNADRMQTVYSYATYSLAVLWVAIASSRSGRGGDDQ
ncbi:hypothetical protein [Galactobacter caseinivorans]|uniref:Uncharacterized protein n=1 Tax=Galactobacter caseinivorans TaxID=2676123 RepID=A0A496PMI6_9MICC|nr:hypothetical protein [Galactobacter caseinivorans]RKW71737.1 hypothetical protein DWQ67_02610 [Galactobacter caseinivorans]